MAYSSKRDPAKRIEFRLKEWGIWLISCYENGQYFPSQSSHLNIPSDSKCATIYPKDNSYAEEINKIVNDMAVHHPDWKMVLKCDYTEPGSQSKKAKNYEMSLAQYRRIIELAKAWIESALSV